MSPTSLTVAEVRAKILYDAIVSAPELVRTAEDVPKLVRVAGWAPAIRDAAFDLLVDNELIVEDAIGVLCVKPPRRAEV